jgi:hypothetical protein
MNPIDNFMIIQFYTSIARMAYRHKMFLILSFIFGILICLIPVISIPVRKDAFYFLGIGVLLIIWGWGLLLTIKWFKPDDNNFVKSYPKKKRKYEGVSSIIKKTWKLCASFFLTAWFFSSFLVIYLIYRLSIS